MERMMIKSDCRIIANNWMPSVREMSTRFHLKAYSNPRPEAKELVLKCTQDTLTLHDARVIKEKAARILGLKYSTLQLYTIEDGCIELHFLISAAVADHIFPVSPSQHSAFSEIGVKIVSE